MIFPELFYSSDIYTKSFAIKDRARSNSHRVPRFQNLFLVSGIVEAS